MMALIDWLLIVSTREEPCDVRLPMLIVLAPVMFCAPPPSDWIQAVLPVASPLTVRLPPASVNACGLDELFISLALALAPLACTRIASPLPFVPVVVIVGCVVTVTVVLVEGGTAGAVVVACVDVVDVVEVDEVEDVEVVEERVVEVSRVVCAAGRAGADGAFEPE